MGDQTLLTHDYGMDQETCLKPMEHINQLAFIVCISFMDMIPSLIDTPNYMLLAQEDGW